MEWHRRVVEASAGGLWVIDLGGRILEANRAAAALLGLTPEELVGRAVGEFHDPAGRQQLATHLLELRQGRTNLESVECQFFRSDGSRVWALVREALLDDDDGRTVVLMNIDDISERKRLFDDLARTQRQRLEAERVARLGSWEWDAVDGSFTWSDGLARLYGERVTVIFADVRSFLEAVHPDDRALVREAIGCVRAGEDSAEFEVRVLAETGYIWIHCRGVANRDTEGRLTGMVGTHVDVTQVRDSDDALRDIVRQQELLQAIASRANQATTLAEVLHDAGALLLLHDDWEHASAYTPGQGATGVIPLAVTEGGEPGVLTREADTAGRSLREGRPVWDDEVRLTLAFPVLLEGEVVAVVAITSRPPLQRYDLIESSATEVAVQLAQVAERERINQELADARDRALEASELKSAFLSSMSHEIRTPLNGVIGLTELVGRTRLDEHQRHLVSGINFSSRSLLAIINDVLDFSKIEAGHLHLEEVDLDIRQVVEQVAGLLAVQAQARGLELVVSCAPDVPRLASGDPTKLAQVMTNLGSNAVKFTPSGRVEIRASVEHDGPRDLLLVQVLDTGVGVPANRLETIFEAFSQADVSTTRLYGGTGLGLAISREIVEAMGGRVGVTSTLGVGSSFWFSVPLHPPTGTGQALTLAPPAVDRLGLLVGDGQRRAPEDQRATRWDATSPASPPARPERVLVVEDNLVNQLVATGFLAGLGLIADTADDGTEALLKATLTDYDLILMDVQMPGLDGYATTRLLRQHEAAEGRRRSPVVALTASAVEGERDRALAAGLDDFVTKPVTGAVITAAVARWLPGGSDTNPSTVAEPDSTPDPDSEGGDGVLDLTRLEDLAQLPGGADYVRRLLASFVEKAGDLVVTVREAAERPDRLASAAHSLKGSAGNVGAVGVSEVAAALETAGHRGQHADPALLDALEVALVEAEGAIARYLSGLDVPAEAAGGSTG